MKRSKKIKSNDKVLVLTGKDKGKIGEVMSVKGDKLIVSGVNVKKRAVKVQSTQDLVRSEEGFKSVSGFIHVSNVAIHSVDKAD